MPHPENDKAREIYGRLFDEVSGILFRHDPIGINFDTNADEYDPEARTILPRLAGCTSEDDVLTVVLEEFRAWFGPDIHEESSPYRQIATEVWQAWQQPAH